MTVGPINHEFKDLGILQLESGKTNPGETNEEYWMRANFDAVTGATYCVEINDQGIRGFNQILGSDPELLDDFLAVKPMIKILSQAVITDFSLKLGSKTYGFSIQIPKYVPKGSLAEVVELHQKNNVLMRRIKKLEEIVAEQNKNIAMLADLCVQQSFQFRYPYEYLTRCVELAGDTPHYYDQMIGCIQSHSNRNGTHLLEMLIDGKLPKLKELIATKRKEIYLAIIGSSSGHYRDYIDRVFDFCCLGIEIDKDIIFEGNVYFTFNGLDSASQPIVVKYTMIEYFNYQVVTNMPRYNTNDTEFQTFIKSPEYFKKCNDIRVLLTNLSRN